MVCVASVTRVPVRDWSLVIQTGLPFYVVAIHRLARECLLGVLVAPLLKQASSKMADTKICRPCQMLAKVYCFLEGDY